jgi:hypothetical protein
MSNQTLWIVGGLAVGALLGYQFAPKLLPYQPYAWIHGKIAPASQVQKIMDGAQAGGQIIGSALMAPIQSTVAAGKQIYSDLQSLFDSGSDDDSSN